VFFAIAVAIVKSSLRFSVSGAAKFLSFRRKKMLTTNQPEVVLGVVGVSRDCFPQELTRRRLVELKA
jgi:hypothetical protein